MRINVYASLPIRTVSPAAAPSGSASRAGTGAADRKQQDAESALKTLTQTATSHPSDAKATARRKVEELKARMQHLRLIHASNPKALARAAAALAKELGAAVKAYKDTGGSPADVAGHAAADPAGAREGPPEAGEASRPDEQATPADQRKAYQASLGLNARHTLEAGDDRTFASEARRIAQQRRSLAAAAKDDAGNRRIRDIESDLDQIGGSSGGSGMAAVPTGSVLSLIA